jgi:dTDP-4-dehydrorhamnose 3,5-epimerase
MIVRDTAIAGIKTVGLPRFPDERGYLYELYRADALAGHGIATPFVQDNLAYSYGAGTVRGLHYQVPPFAQAKLVAVLRGRILDVAVDIRRGSPSFGRHVALVLSAAEGTQLYIPEGFAHGYCTLEPDTEILYKMSAPYAPRHEAGLRWDDPALGIAWPAGLRRPILSAKDKTLPLLAEAPAHFHYAAG